MAPNNALIRTLVRMLGLTLLAGYLQAQTLVSITDTWRVFKGTVPPADEWNAAAFESMPQDGWLSLKGGFVGGQVGMEQATRFTDYGQTYRTMYFRRTFRVEQPETIQRLVLRVLFKHGMVVWLNGHRLFAEGFPETPEGAPTHEAFATGRANFLFEEHLIDQGVEWLKPGENLLAVQVHPSETDLSFEFMLELLGNFSRQPILHHVEETRAVLSWRNPKAERNRIRYGLTQSMRHLVEKNAPQTHQSVTLEQLIPNSTYFYQIESETEDGWISAPPQTFATPDPTELRLRFAVLGDSGIGGLAQYGIASQITGSAPDFVIHTGDTCYPSLMPELVDWRYYSVYARCMEKSPFYVAIGNHDIDLGLHHYPSLFVLPTNNTPSSVHQIERTSPEAYYSIRRGNVEVFFLYTPFFYQYELKNGNPQFQWLEAELERSTSPWKFVVTHHPIQTSSAHRFDDYNHNGRFDVQELQQTLMPLLQKHGVQMVFSGHDHIYERFQPLNGIVTLTSAGGGAHLYTLRERDQASSQYRRHHHYLLVEVEDDVCEVQAIGLSGQVLDSMRFARSPEKQWDAASTWHTPQVVSDSAEDGDGNLTGQAFDLQGADWTAQLGQSSHAGTCRINNDREFLYLGFHSVTLPDDGALFVLLGTDEAGDEGIEPLHSFSPAVRWDHGTPRWLAILGDEKADATNWSFDRSGSGLWGPQGFFRIDEAWTPIHEATVQQFNIHPPSSPSLDTALTHLQEQNADFIEIAIPFSAIAPLHPGSNLRITAMTGKQPIAGALDPWQLDTSALARSVDQSAPDLRVIEPLTIHLVNGPDQDKDGLSDPDESMLALDPMNPDSDHDGLPDGWEFDHGLSPSDASSSNGSLGDPDEDGLSNQEEWLFGTHPMERHSRFQWNIRSVDDASVRIEWPSFPDRSYTLLSAPTATGPYAPVLSKLQNPYRSGGQRLSHTFSTEAQETRFWKLQVEAISLP